MIKQNRRGAPWLYIILALLAAALLYLLGWPIARQVILHRGQEVFEETDRPAGLPGGAPAQPDEGIPDEP